MKCTIPEYCKQQYKNQGGQCDTCIIEQYGNTCVIQEYLATSSLQEYIYHIETCPTCIKNNIILQNHKSKFNHIKN